MRRYKAYLEAQAAGASPAELAKMREEMLAGLKNMVDSKLLYIDAMKTIPVDGQKDIEHQIDASFDDTQVKDLIERTKTKTTSELDAKLREYGTSLDRRRRAFFEQQLGRLWLQQQSKKDGDDDIAFTAMLDYYQRHLRDYDFAAKARWEELMVRFDRFSSKGEAYQALADMGNQVLHGVNFGEVAKARSQGPTAELRGARDRTNRGALPLRGARPGPVWPAGRGDEPDPRRRIRLSHHPRRRAERRRPHLLSRRPAGNQEEAERGHRQEAGRRIPRQAPQPHASLDDLRHARRLVPGARSGNGLQWRRGHAMSYGLNTDYAAAL